MPTLADIEHEIATVLAVPEELAEEDRQPLALDYLDSLALQEAEKVDGVSYAVRKRKSQIEWLQNEERRLRSRRQSMERRLASFREYLAALMTHYGVRSLKGNVGSVSLRSTRSVAVDDIGSVPAGYKTVTVEERPDKQALRQALLGGDDIAGARLVERETLSVR